MKNKINFFIICMMFGMLLGVASAEIQTLGTKEQGEDLRLPMVCPDCTFNNITSITAPDSTQLIGERVMTKTGTVYNFTLGGGNLTQIGEYIVTGLGDLGGTNTIWTYNFFITPSGFDFSTSEAIVYFVLVFIVFIFLSLFIYLSVVIPYSNETDAKGAITRVTKSKYIKLFFIWLSSGFLVLFLSILSGIFNNFINLDTFSSLITNFYLIFYLLNRVLTFLILGIAMIEIYRDILFNKEIIKFGKAIIHGNP